MKFPSSREQMEHEMETDISQIETRVTIRDPGGNWWHTVTSVRETA